MNETTTMNDDEQNSKTTNPITDRLPTREDLRGHYGRLRAFLIDRVRTATEPADEVEASYHARLKILRRSAIKVAAITIVGAVGGAMIVETLLGTFLMITLTFSSVTAVGIAALTFVGHALVWLHQNNDATNAEADR